MPNLPIRERNKALILEYVRARAGGSPAVSKARQVIYFDKLITIARIMPVDFDKATREDIDNVVEKLGQRKYTNQTLMTMLSVLKRFYQYLYRGELASKKDYPEPVKGITISIKRESVIHPCDLITNDDMKKILTLDMHARDKAFIVSLFESGCRISELGNASIGGLKFDTEGVILMTAASKTITRPVRLVLAAPYLREWLEMHPQRNDPNAALWVSIEKRGFGRHVTYNRLRDLVQQHMKRAGIEKPAKPHMYRHSRATLLVSVMKEIQMCRYLGWKLGSNMPQVYVHLSEKGVEAPILAQHGLAARGGEEVKVLSPKICVKCGTFNMIHVQKCQKCGGRVLPLPEAISIRDTPQAVEPKVELVMNQQTPERKSELDAESKTETQPSGTPTPTPISNDVKTESTNGDTAFHTHGCWNITVS